MKVVHVVLSGDVAGGQMVALRLARATRNAGHEVALVSPTPGPFLDRVAEAGLPGFVVPLGGALDLCALLRLTRVLRREHPDVVHTHGHFSVNILARIAGRLAGARVLAHMHIENAFRDGRGRRLQILLDNLTARLCFVLVAVSDSTRRALLSQGYPAGRVVTIHNGVEPAGEVEPVALAPSPVVLEVARLAEVKGQADLLAALSRLERGTVVLAGADIEGDGAYERLLRREAARLGVSARVVFAGHRDDVAALIAGCDVFCLPSLAEGLPLGVLDAMARGRPVVATAVGGTPEVVVDGETGFLVPPGDVEALADSLDRLLTDESLRRRAGEAGRARVEREFSADVAAARVLGLYEGAAYNPGR